MQIVPNQRGVNLSVICAVTSWGEILYRLHDGSVNGNKLQVFLEEVLIPRLAVWVPKPRLLLMDNVKFHHKPSVQQEAVLRLEQARVEGSFWAGNQVQVLGISWTSGVAGACLAGPDYACNCTYCVDLCDTFSISSGGFTKK